MPGSVVAPSTSGAWCSAPFGSHALVNRFDEYLNVLADPILRLLRRQLLGQRGDMLDLGADLRLRQLAVGGRRFGALLVGVAEDANGIQPSPNQEPF